MPLRTTHIAQKLKAAATLLLLLLCVCSAVARDTTRVFSKLPWDANTASGANGLGGAYVNTYNYDDLYRLTAANGSYSGNNTNYSLEMSYTPAGRLCSKLQDFTATANTYAYSQNAKPHAVRRYYNGLTNELYNLRWDNNGNLAQQTLYSVNNNTTNYQTMRMLFWDEDDRLNLVAGDGYLSYYAYGHDGNRAIKMTGNAAIDQTGTLLNSTNLENITIYPNEYLTVTQAEYTKYYYAGGNRIASKIGTGGFEKMTRLCTLDQSPTYNANTLLNFVLYQVTNISNQPTDEYPVNPCGGYNVSTELFTNPLPDFYISNTALNFTQNNLLQQFRQNLAGGTEAVYYFHSDHLGSASWITNGTGAAVQHLLYLPFGEHFANEHSSNYDERFTFTGKERDAETGYYYHGARFNSSDIGWISVDPKFDKYPSLTPYNYCAWNPIKLVDPEGEEIWKPEVYRNGDVCYMKEAGDNASTLQKQYGLSANVAQQLYGTMEKGRISGKSVARLNSGNQILKVDWNKATDHQKIYHAFFAILYGIATKQVAEADMNNFFNNLPSKKIDKKMFMGVNNNSVVVRGFFRLPLMNGEEVYAKYASLVVNKETSRIGNPQQPTQVDPNRTDSDWKQQYTQIPGNLPRMHIRIDNDNCERYLNDYYK